MGGVHMRVGAMALALAFSAVPLAARAQTAWDGVFSGTGYLTAKAINGVYDEGIPPPITFTATVHGFTSGVSDISFHFDIKQAGVPETVSDFDATGLIYGPTFSGANYSEYLYGVRAENGTFGDGNDYRGVSIGMPTDGSYGAGGFVEFLHLDDGSTEFLSYELDNVTYNGDDKPPVTAVPPPPAAPEPATWALMAAGVGMAGLALRRRQPAAQAVMSAATA